MGACHIYKLKGVVQHYAWGGFVFIPRLLGLENKEHQPFAEYWLGAHPNHSSNTDKGPLAELISKDAEGILGSDAARKFGSLPFLVKVLDVRQMLSIQVHPSRREAEIGFERENRKQIPVNAFNRNYKDQNHKPEAMVALSDFYLLHGFKKKEKLEKTLTQTPELRFLNEVFCKLGYRGIYEEVMLMRQERVNDILKPLMERIIPKYQSDSLEKNTEDFWAARAALHFCKNGIYDRGIFSIYFFNLLHLKQGEGIFQPAGLPHAYLEGQNVEVMANSDNVLRAGLTDKYIDVNELLKHVRFEPTLPKIIKRQSPNHNVFSTPAEEFELHQYELKKGDELMLTAHSSEILLMTEGTARVKSLPEIIELARGESALIIAGSKIEIEVVAPLTLFRVTTPSRIIQ